jgi:plastocyanin
LQTVAASAKRRALAAAAFVCLAVAAGCGEEEGEPGAAKKAPAAKPSTVLSIASVPPGKLRFEPAKLDAKPGPARIEFSNRESVAHNVQIEQSDECCARSGARYFGGTQTTTVKGETTATTKPLERGEYWFYCSVGGHWQGGMRGRLTVR